MSAYSIQGAFSSPGPPSTFSTPSVLADQSEALSFHTEARSEHPSFWHLVGLVCEAVLEVVCVSGLGFIAAKRGLFPAKVQKDVANLNIYFFTPCLIFSKLSSQLTGDKLTELWIIPIILFVQTVVSWLAAEAGTRILKMNKKPQRNFVTAMAVFGNSNSLPLSLVISLSHTISGLHWDRLPGDNDDEVGARGILYLLVFSQLGQAVRWSWGMNTLLRPMDDYTSAERGELPRDEEEHDAYKDDEGASEDAADDSQPSSSLVSSSSSLAPSISEQIKTDEFATGSGRAEPLDDANGHVKHRNNLRVPGVDAAERRPHSPVMLAAHNAIEYSQHASNEFAGWRAKTWTRSVNFLEHSAETVSAKMRATGKSAFSYLPHWLQTPLYQTWRSVALVVSKVYSCLNVPLMAIIVAVVVGSVPALKAIFYTKGTFVNNTVTAAVNQLAGVAVPLILFVLGGNLCKSTLPGEDLDDKAYRREKGQMLWVSIICRMLVPLLVMAPLLALLAKYAPISILDDPIFIIVCFLLTGAPSALQLAQICQVNDVYVPVISSLLLYSYVFLIFPSTIILVMLALEVVKWAG